MRCGLCAHLPFREKTSVGKSILADTTITTTKSHFLTLFSWVFESLVKSLMLVKSQRKWFCLLFWRYITISYLLIFAPVQSHYFCTFSAVRFFSHLLFALCILVKVVDTFDVCNFPCVQFIIELFYTLAFRYMLFSFYLLCTNFISTNFCFSSYPHKKNCFNLCK